MNCKQYQNIFWVSLCRLEFASNLSITDTKHFKNAITHTAIRVLDIKSSIYMYTELALSRPAEGVSRFIWYIHSQSRNQYFQVVTVHAEAAERNSLTFEICEVQGLNLDKGNVVYSDRGTDTRLLFASSEWWVGRAWSSGPVRCRGRPCSPAVGGARLGGTGWDRARGAGLGGTGRAGWGWVSEGRDGTGRDITGVGKCWPPRWWVAFKFVMFSWWPDLNNSRNFGHESWAKREGCYIY